MARKQSKPKELTRDELFRRFVGNIGQHCANLYSDSQQTFCLSAVHGLEPVTFKVQQRGEQPDVWDRCIQVHDDGTEEWLGNRCAMVSRYSKLCAEALQAWLEETKEAA